MLPSEAADCFIKAVSQKNSVVFFELPDINVAMDPQHLKLLSPNDKRRSQDFLALDVEGTTFSGHPLTTFGNTMRTILYALFYLRKSPKYIQDKSY